MRPAGSLGEEEEITAPARAEQIARGKVDEMPVIVGDDFTAQLADLPGTWDLPWPGLANSLQHRERVSHPPGTSTGHVS